MPNQTPPFLLLKLRSTDDENGAIPTWRGLVGGREPLVAHVTMHYHEQVAGLPLGTPVVVDVHGTLRRFGVLSIEPAPDATRTDLALFRVPGLPTEAPTGPFLLNLGCGSRLIPN